MYAKSYEGKISYANVVVEKVGVYLVVIGG